MGLLFDICYLAWNNDFMRIALLTVVLAGGTIWWSS